MIPYNPLAGGLLTGKHSFDAGPSEGRFTGAVGKAGAMYTQRYWHEREFHTIEQINKIVAPTGRSLAGTALAWVLANPAVSSAIIGASRPKQLDETLTAVDQPIDPDIKAKLDEATVEYRFGDALR